MQIMHIRSFQNWGNLGNRFKSWPSVHWDSRIVEVALPISEVAADESAKASAHPVESTHLIFYPIQIKSAENQDQTVVALSTCQHWPFSLTGAIASEKLLGIHANLGINFAFGTQLYMLYTS